MLPGARARREQHTLGTERVFPNLRFPDEPVHMLQVKGDSSRWFVVERFGTVRVFENSQDVTTTSDFLNIDARVDSACAECGLLSMAFHPDLPATPRVYVTYTTLDRTEFAGRIHTSRNSPRPTADSRSIPIPSA